ncbi:MAG: hypothetical protein HOY79_17460 [Streptomyces sp.]|nr:hypothetical protein [Streptomyces sp.]
MSTETAAVLDEAANVIRRNGWHQGDYYNPHTSPGSDDPRSCPVCLLGSIAVAAGQDPENWIETSQSRDAALAVGRRLGIDLAPGGNPIDFDDEHDIEHLACQVGGWNDRDDREAEDVIAVLEAAARAERERAL